MFYSTCTYFRKEMLRFFLRVRCGCQLSTHPFHNGREQAVALVYEHQEGQPSKAVCVDKGLDFTIGEMSSSDLGPLTNNRLFRGGEVGTPGCQRTLSSFGFNYKGARCCLQEA